MKIRFNKKQYFPIFLMAIMYMLISCSAIKDSHENSTMLIQEARTAFLEHNDINASLRLLRKVRGRDSENFREANILAGKLHMKQTNYKRALRHFKRASRADRSCGFAKYYIAYMYQKLQKPQTAYKYYKRSIFLDRDLLNPEYNPLVVQNIFTERLYIYIYTIEEDHLFSPIEDSFSFYDERVIARIP